MCYVELISHALVVGSVVVIDKSAPDLNHIRTKTSSFFEAEAVATVGICF